MGPYICLIYFKITIIHNQLEKNIKYDLWDPGEHFSIYFVEAFLGWKKTNPMESNIFTNSG